jgi:dihydroxyacetone kinase
VAVISGGGSGHEPTNGGLVGPGLLTAAVCGGVCASPSVDSVLHTLRTVTGPRGAVMVVLNYTGDRLNFGLAAEQAKAEGLLVEVVFVADDAALDEGKGVTGRRGLAGLCLVHKVAGAAAAAGCSLSEVAAAARRAAAQVRTVGCALSVCHVPGKRLGGEARLLPDE